MSILGERGRERVCHDSEGSGGEWRRRRGKEEEA